MFMAVYTQIHPGFGTKNVRYQCWLYYKLAKWAKIWSGIPVFKFSYVQKGTTLLFLKLLWKLLWEKKKVCVYKVQNSDYYTYWIFLEFISSKSAELPSQLNNTQNFEIFHC